MLLVLSFLALSSPTPSVETVSEAVAMLADELKKRIEVRGRVAGDFVFVDPHGAGARIVLDGLAQATYCEVQHEDDRWVFSRTPKSTARMEDDRDTIRRRWLDIGLPEIELAGRSGSNSDPVGAFFTALKVRSDEINQAQASGHHLTYPPDPTRGLPVMSVMASVLQRIGVPNLARLPSDSTSVFATRPKYGEQAMPDIADAVAIYERAMEPFRTVVIDDERRALLDAAPSYNALVSSWTSTRLIDSLRLIVRSGPIEIDCQLEAFDQHGTRIFSQHHDFDSRGATGDAPQGGDTDVSLSAPASSFLQFLTSESSGSGYLVNDWPDAFSKPDKFEPMESYPQEAINMISGTAQTRPFIAVLDDSSISVLSSCLKSGKADLSSVMHSLKDWDRYRVSKELGCTLLRPGDLSWAERTQSRRPVLASYVRQLQKAGPDLRELCVSWSTASQLPGPLMNLWSLRAQVELGTMPIHGGCPELYAALGNLSDSTWQSLTMGKVLSVEEAGIAPSLRHWLAMDLSAEFQGPATSDLERLNPASLDENTLRHGLIVLAPQSETEFQLNPAGPALVGHPIAVLPGALQLEINDVRRQDDTPYVVVTRAEFERRHSDIQIQFMQHTSYRFLLRLGDDQIERTLDVSSKAITGVLHYSQLSEAFRLQVWNAVCALALDPKAKPVVIWVGPVKG